jgi:dinuclear metal center YbgI/SA1388 family protein
MGANQPATGNAVPRDELVRHLHEFLQVDRFSDHCPNGLQVEGRPRIARIASGVTASLALIEAACEQGADALLVHHGYFWRGEDARIVGQKQRRLQALLRADLNLLAYHLPLDAHDEVGNNAQLAQRLGFEATGAAGEQGLVRLGRSREARTVGELARLVQQRLGRAPLLVGEPDRVLDGIAWCTGAAQSAIGEAQRAGAMLYLSGEISEPTAHFAREMGIAYLACGHHATERYGVQALGEHLAAAFGIEHRFIDIDNPA